MAIGGVNLNAGNLLVVERGLVERSPAEPRRNDASAPERERSRDAEALPSRQEFVLGASGYRRVLATLESDAAAGSKERVLRDGDGSYTGQRAQRAYQDAAGDGERESVARLFGVDVFA